MSIYIALFRGINVGGNTRLPMSELTSVLEALGLRNVATYIQSGNVVFESAESDRPALSEKIRSAIDQRHGFAPQVILLTVDEFARAAAANPFPEAEPEPKSLHLYFLEAVPPHPDLEKLEAIRRENERFALIDKVFYLHAPGGIGRSKLAAGVEKAMGVPVTARNWRTVSKMLEMTKR